MDSKLFYFLILLLDLAHKVAIWHIYALGGYLLDPQTAEAILMGLMKFEGLLGALDIIV
jgi:hypothetical protein